MFHWIESFWWHWDETISDRNTVILQHCTNSPIKQEAELSLGINVWIRVHCNEECSGNIRVIVIQAMHVWGSDWWINKYLLWQLRGLGEHDASQIEKFQEALQYCLTLHARSGRGGNSQSVERAYINQLGEFFTKAMGSLKREEQLEFFTCWEANWSMCFF